MHINRDMHIYSEKHTHHCQVNMFITVCKCLLKEDNYRLSSDHTVFMKQCDYIDIKSIPSPGPLTTGITAIDESVWHDLLLVFLKQLF